MGSLTFYGGVSEIGGNKIILEDKNTSVWLDFGKGFNQGFSYFTGYLQPRGICGLKDLFEFDLLPKIEGLYSEEMLMGTGIQYKKPSFSAVLISHAHSDHIGDLRYLDPSIVVYSGTGTKIFMESQEETSNISDYGKHEYKNFRTGDILKIDGIDVEPIHVDHSIPAAYGFIIYTSSGAIVYTGDIRAHGPKSEMTEEFLDAAEDAEPIAMVCEGTRMEFSSKRRNLSEAQVRDGVIDICREADFARKLIIYTHGPRDMDRLNTFRSAAERCGRNIVVTPRIAYLLTKLVQDVHLNLPDPTKDTGISVYFKRKKSGTYDDKDYYFWERTFLDKKVTHEELKQRPKEYMLSIDFSSLTELIDIRPEAGTPYIFSMSEHIAEEDVESQILQNWVNHFNLNYQQLHASGHMSRGELEDAVLKVKPKRLYPVHTENPKMFTELYPKTILPIKGKKLSF